jgi:exopolyphosphatase / guanosine-5'-triphosphate,3'-diphosphate pyrophosphatase
MRAAAIDIGSNSTLALLAELERGELRTVHDTLTLNQLGSSVDASGEFSREVIALNVDLLNEIVRDFRREGAEAFVLCGTSAMRRARNAAELSSAAQQILGLNIEVLSGRDEAALTFAGAISGREIYPNERIGVIDLGGGSTEVIAGRGSVPAESTSIDFGAVSLTNAFVKSDPASAEEIGELRRMLKLRLPLLVGNLRGRQLPWTLVGGTVVTLAMLKKGLRFYDPLAVSGQFLSAEDIDKLITGFSGKRAAELQSLPGMPAGRGKYIRAGAILLSEFFAVLQIEEGMVSERGLRHGLWLAKFSEQGVR